MSIPVSTAQMRDVMAVYNSDSTIQACRGVLNSVLDAADLQMNSGTGGPATATEQFHVFMQDNYMPFVVEALDHIRMFGFVVYSLHKTAKEVVPYVAPFGTFTVQMAILSGHRRVMRASSTIGNGGRQSALHVFVETMPTTAGHIMSPVSTVSNKIMSVGLLLSAAVESDMNAALPTLVTQAIPEKTNVGGDIYNSSELEGFFGSHASDVLADRAEQDNRRGMDMLMRQQELARKINAGDTSKRSVGQAYLNAGVMSLPKGQQLVNPTMQSTRQDLPRMREDLARMVCCVMGVPLGLLDPSATSMHNESLTCKVFSTQLAKQAKIGQNLLSVVYKKSFDDNSDETSTPRFTIMYQSFTSAEDLYAAYDREVIDEKAIRMQIARNLGMDERQISKKARKEEPSTTGTGSQSR